MNHRFTVGDLNCIAFTEGQRMATWEAAKGFFANAPENELLPVYEATPEARRRFSINPLYIENFGLLIDTGNGVTAEPPNRVINLMKAIGIAPESVQIIFITHAHPDHIGGLTDEHGELAFPNARYVMGQHEWDFWMHDGQGLPPEFLAQTRQKLALLEHELILIEPDDEIAAGITAVEAYGHTPGHLAVMIESKGEKLLHIVDTAHTPIQVRQPDWSPHFDLQPQISPITRRKILQKAADENLRVYSYHFAFPPLGYVIQTESGLSWQFEA